jgi:hypothetical protein
MIEAKADVNPRNDIGDSVFTIAIEDDDVNSMVLLLDHGGGTPASDDTDEYTLGDVLENSESDFHASEQSAALMLARASADTKAYALGVVLIELEEGASLPASKQAMAFMLLAHGANTRDVALNTPFVHSPASMYANTHLFIEKWHGIALNALSERVEVDRRVGLGLNGLYQEPLERVLQYLGLSMGVDQVVNSSLDDAEGVQRALLPNCARNANLWFQLHQQNNHEEAAAEITEPMPQL